MSAGTIVQEIAKGLAQVYKAEGVAIWLLSPHKLLDGEPAAALILRGEGGRVLDLIDALCSGAYV